MVVLLCFLFTMLSKIIANDLYANEYEMVVLVGVFISGLDIRIHSSYIFAFSIYFT